MRVVDLDRDMRDVIPTGMTRDSEFLFRRMTEATLGRSAVAPGGRVLDLASGVGQDAAALAAGGAFAVGVEPSARMLGLARLAEAQRPASVVHWVRAWSDALPFADGAFDASFCKGSLDHFDRPRRAISELARVTRDGGRVVLAIANFDSAACRLTRLGDRLRERVVGRVLPRGRRHYDVPHDHFTRYELDLMREQASEWLDVDTLEGISLAWGIPGWSRLLRRLPERLALNALQWLDAGARLAPAWADVVVLSGRPRRSSMASA